MPVMAPPLLWSSSTHGNQSWWCHNKDKSCVSVFLFFVVYCKPLPFFVRWRGLSVCRPCLPFNVLSCQARQSSWLYEDQALSRSIEVVATCHLKNCACACVKELLTFFLCRRPLRLRGGLYATCRLSTAFFPTPPNPSKLFIPATLALTRCLSGWNSSGLKAQTWQQATTHQLDSAVTERRKQKMRYKVTGGWGRGGWESVIVLELLSLHFPIPPWRLPKIGILGCLRFSLWPRWLVVTQANSGCVSTRLHPVHICIFEE